MNNEEHNKGKEMTIIVNAREHKWNEKMISYEEVIKLAYDTYTPDDNTAYTVTFKKGDDTKKEGSLVAGESVKVKDEMIFNVTKTSKS